ncbi:histone-lysine N-methyltransferase SETMAR [Plakobranchus ocellatus]|uniref:Histone-lysine N-methyltransferase SETMAR n=1 Tax=Plakobranchus ocellatus TaxID=259542 RepID=A0AAV4B7U9_9GAST|nr:histone-lysine N-methyltransferase SETMAR [Plakobranchus ocellatus]
MSKRITPFASRYCSTLDRLKEAIRRKRPGLLRRGVVLQHDIATPHSANLTQQWLQRYGWEILPHPAHSPDLAPSDFHLFGSLKRHLVGMAFETEDDLIMIKYCIEKANLCLRSKIANSMPPRATRAQMFADFLLLLPGNANLIKVDNGKQDMFTSCLLLSEAFLSHSLVGFENRHSRMATDRNMNPQPAEQLSGLSALTIHAQS